MIRGKYGELEGVGAHKSERRVWCGIVEGSSKMVASFHDIHFNHFIKLALKSFCIWF